LLLFIVCSGYTQQELKFEVHTGNSERINTPLSIEIHQLKETELSALSLFETTGGINSEIPFQVDQEYKTLLWFTLSGTTSPNTTRTFLISTKQGAKEFQQLQIEKDDKILKIKSGEVIKTFFNTTRQKYSHLMMSIQSINVQPLYTQFGHRISRC
jgi:hypothetical protein